MWVHGPKAGPDHEGRGRGQRVPQPEPAEGPDEVTSLAVQLHVGKGGRGHHGGGDTDGQVGNRAGAAECFCGDPARVQCVQQVRRSFERFPDIAGANVLGQVVVEVGGHGSSGR